MDSGAGGTGAMGGTPEKTVNDRKSLFFHIQLWMCDVKYSPLTAGAHRDPVLNVYFTSGRRPRSVIVMQYFTLTFS